MTLEGIFCPIITPFVNDRVSADKLSFNLDKFNSTDLDGYVLFGSTGEAPYVSVQERIELLKAARDLISATNKKLIVGTGYERANDTVAFTKQAAECGAEYALVLTPSYYKSQMDDRVLINHFSTVADQSPIPILIYNVPPFTGVDMTVKAVTELAGHPNIIGIKDSTANLPKLLTLIKACASKLSILIGNAHYYPTALMAGASGAVLAVSNILPDECAQVFKNHGERAYEKTKGPFSRISATVSKIISPYGIPAIKSAMDSLGFYGGPPRKPMLPVSDEIRQQVEDHLRSLELL